MNKSNMLMLVAVAALLFVSGCASNIPIEYSANINPVGFWHGLWHGMVAPFAFIGSLFNKDIAVYAVYNTGNWYTFGFMLGVGGFTKGCSSSCRRRK
jgi:hypothetical protein